MTTLKTQRLEKIKEKFESDFREVNLKRGSKIKRENDLEDVIETFYEGGRLVRFWSVKRNNKGIKEYHYSVNPKTGVAHLDGSGEFYGQDTGVNGSRGPFIAHSSERYSELDKFLREMGK